MAKPEQALRFKSDFFFFSMLRLFCRSQNVTCLILMKLETEDVWWTCNPRVCFPVTADTFLVEGNKQEHQLSNLKPSTTYSVALYATKGPLTSGTVVTNLQTRTCSFHSAALWAVGGAWFSGWRCGLTAGRFPGPNWSICVELKCSCRVLRGLPRSGARLRAQIKKKNEVELFLQWLPTAL